MVFSIAQTAGIDLDRVYTVADIAAGEISGHALGTQVFGSDGKLYVYAEANATISASDTDCTVSASTFLATASGGSYTSPATAMVDGDQGWFSKASV